MTRSKRIQEDSEEKKNSFLKAADDVFTEKDQAPRKVEVSTNGNPVASKEGKKEVLRPPHVSVLFPQRLKDKSEDEQFARFVEMLKKVHINIPFVEAIAQMSKYAKYLKEILSNKGKLVDFATIALNKECSTIILRKLLHKLSDPMSFLVHYIIGNLQINRALCDLGSVYKKQEDSRVLALCDHLECQYINDNSLLDK